MTDDSNEAELVPHFYADAAGVYIGAHFTAPEGAVEVTSMPARGDQHWNGARWVYPARHYVTADGLYAGAAEEGTQDAGLIEVSSAPEDAANQTWREGCWHWRIHYCRDAAGNFLGTFDTPLRPAGAIDCAPPPDGRMKWIDGAWAFTPEVMLSLVREERDRRIAAVQWRYERHARETRLGIQPTDDLAALDGYVQALADITETQADLENVDWPAEPV